MSGGWDWEGDAPTPAQIRAGENQTRVFERLREITSTAGALRPSFVLTPALVCELHQIGMADLVARAGEIRCDDVDVVGAAGIAVFSPPPAADVSELLREACAYVTATFATHHIHAAAYALWRLNWIHPFGEDGNGRTARAVAYLTLCVGFGRWLPGALTIPERIARNRYPYWDALRAADRAWAEEGRIDVSDMETYLGDLLQAQLDDAPL